MSWTEELAKVYELAIQSENDSLLPLYHGSINAQITLTLNPDGTIPSSGFVEVVPKDEQVTVVPVTMASSAKTSGIAPRMLSEDIRYIAGDYSKYVAAPKEGKKTKNYFAYFDSYISQLESWCNSEFSHPSARAVFAYLSQGTLIKDLLDVGFLQLDAETGKLIDRKINGIAFEKCVVRFQINYIDGSEAKTWKDKTLFQSCISYNSSLGAENTKQLCYYSGKRLVPTYNHPKFIRFPSDQCKLISANDSDGFSYRGRFLDKTEAVSVSYEYSQKMHNALKWLISKQGVHIGDLCVVVWESALNDIPKPLDDFGFDDFGFSDEYSSVERNKELLTKSLFGTKNKFSPDSKAMIMSLDSATPGRLAMTMYSELSTSDYLQNLSAWHISTSWVREKGAVRSFAMREIAKCAFGTEQGGKLECKSELEKETVQRLLPCAAEGRRIPRDIVRAVVARACRPSSYGEKYLWKKVLECACGMYRKQVIEEKGECSMALDTECRSRDYLYGRLLAVADAAEESTYDKETARTTNAKRFFEAFSNRPYQTWSVIYKHLRPYFDRMPRGRRIFYESLIGEITEMFERDEFVNNSPLKPEFLHAYSCQINDFYHKKTDTKEEQ